MSAKCFSPGNFRYNSFVIKLKIVQKQWRLVHKVMRVDVVRHSDSIKPSKLIRSTAMKNDLEEN